MKRYFQIHIATKSSEEAECLIAELSAINFYAFEQENNWLNAYITEPDFDEQKLKGILPAGASYREKIIEEENWNEKWEKTIEPIIVNDFVAIRPSFSKPTNKVKFDLIITPKMSFGTGHHPTTFLMVEIMESIDFHDKSVIDFGTGTGVLAILAEKCGAPKVTAIDFDDWSIQNASENIEVNGCRIIEIRQQSNLSGIDLADIVLANINLNVLRDNSVRLKSLIKKGGLLLLSGFLGSDEAQMVSIFHEKNLVKIKSRQRGEWLAMLFKNV